MAGARGRYLIHHRFGSVGPVMGAIALAIVLALVLVLAQAAFADAGLLRPGDDRTGYESADYVSNSRSIQERVGREADLLAILRSRHLGLPELPANADNLPTGVGIQLGRKLFFDRRLSLNNTMSCAICHVPEMGFANNELRIAVGMEGRSGRRNAPTLFNVGYRTRLFHDGRESTLENQVWSPFLSRHEMANPSVGYIIDKIRSFRDYDGLFERAFSGKGPSVDTIGKALAQYQRTLIAAASPFDRWYYANEEAAIDESRRRGFEVFSGKGGCIACHLVGKDFALFTDNRMHNTGLGYDVAMNKGGGAATRSLQLAPGVFTVIDDALVEKLTQQPTRNDLGLYEITLNPADRWKYLTPTLRNVELTAPYMHNGVFSTLEEVIEFYDRGGIPNQGLSPLIRALGLTAREKRDLRNFLLSLTSPDTKVLVGDAFAAPVGAWSEDAAETVPAAR